MDKGYVFQCIEKAIGEKTGNSIDADVIRATEALAADFAFERGEEFWTPANPLNITLDDLDRLEEFFRETIYGADHDVTERDNFSPDVIEVLNEICAQVALHYETPPRAQPAPGRTDAVFQTLRLELALELDRSYIN